jgi:coenzyme F420 hydrogenase subunit beta
MSVRLDSIMGVPDSGLCTGCGACAYLCNEKKLVDMIDVENVGHRPSFRGDCDTCELCLSVCPGASVDRSEVEVGCMPGMAECELGKVLEIWEGYATDPAMRSRGSSGGVVSALASYCIEREPMQLVLHTAGDPQKPWTNVTVTSRTREEIVARAGSRYAPSSPCDGLSLLEKSDKPGVFIGKPCDVAAVAAIRKMRPALDEKVGLAISVFCAGTPASLGTLELLASVGIKPHEVKALHYRGDGWPGKFQVTTKNGKRIESISYAESWAKLGKFRPLRCSVCPDGMGSLADIACGDAWEQYNGSRPNTGMSLVVVRTERGRAILRRAIEAGYVRLSSFTEAAVFAAQPNLVRKHREVFGRLLAMRMLGIPIPRFVGFALFQGWMKVSMSHKVRSVLGTMRRAVLRGWWKRRGRLARQV